MAGISSARFLVEMDGVSIMDASEVSGIGLKHEVVKIAVGSRANPHLARGNYECEEITLKHAHALNSAGFELSLQFDSFIRGLDVGKPTFRLIQLGEDGFETVAIWEAFECVPTMFSQESNKADSNDAAYFTLKFKPTDLISVF